MRESCISHRARQPIAVVRQDYYELMDNDATAAALMNIFEYWANAALSKSPNDNAPWLGERTIHEFQDLMLGISTDKQIRKRLTLIKERGFIETRQPKKHRKTLEYRFFISRVQSALDGLNNGQTTVESTVKQPLSQRSNNRRVNGHLTAGSTVKQPLHYIQEELENKYKEAPPEPGAPPTQDLCVPGESGEIQPSDEQTETPETPSPSLLQKPESTPKVEIALLEIKGSAAPCDNTTSQSSQYSLHPTAKQDALFQRRGLEPWLDKPGLNGWKPGFIEFYRQYLSSTPRYMQTLNRSATPGDAKNSLIELTRSEEGKAKIQNHWDNYQSSLQPSHQSVQYQTAPDTIHQARKPIKLSGKKI